MAAQVPIWREGAGHQPRALAKARWLLEGFLVLAFGSSAIGQIDAQQILAALRKIEAKGAHEPAQRAMQKCSQVFRYAIATGRAKGDPTWDLRGALEPVESKNRAALTDPGPVGGLLRAIDGYVGQPVTQAALKLHPRRSSTNVLRRSIETTLLNGHSR